MKKYFEEAGKNKKKIILVFKKEKILEKGDKLNVSR